MAKKDEKNRVRKKRKILIIVGIIVLVVVAGGAGVALRWWQTANEQDGTSETEEEEMPPLPGVIDNLQNLRSEGDTETFDQDLAAALENPDYDDPTRALLYIQKGSVAYDNKDFNAAMEAFLRAEELDPSSQTAQLIGFTYQELGNNPKAIEYYQLTIERLDPGNILYEADKAYFEERIKRLQG